MTKKDNRIKYNLLSGLVYQVVLIVLSFLPSFIVLALIQ